MALPIFLRPSPHLVKSAIKENLSDYALVVSSHHLITRHYYLFRSASPLRLSMLSRAISTPRSRKSLSFLAAISKIACLTRQLSGIIRTESDMRHVLAHAFDASDVSANMHNLINLIDSLHSRADFNPQHVSQVAQIELEEYLNPPDGSYEYTANATTNWNMTYTLWPNQDNGGFSRIFFDFSSRLSNENSSMTDICTVDLDAFHNALLQRGYQHTENNRSGLIERLYRRNKIKLTIGYAGESPDKVEHDCIRYINIIGQGDNES